MGDNISDAQRAAMIGEVIILSRKVEGKLHELCGSTEVAGIHALTELLSGRLPEDLKRQLHFIAAVRNGAAHEENFSQSSEEFQRFRQCCQNTLETLQRLFPENGQTPANNADDEEKTLDVAVERELVATLNYKISRLGYFPLAGNFYLLYVLLYAILQQGFMLLLTGLYFCSAILGIRGWQSSADRGLLYIAGGAMLFAYIATTFLSFYAPIEKLPKVIGLLPAVNVIYLLMRFLRDLKWGRFITALIGLAALAAAIFAAVKGMYIYAAILLGINWIDGIIAAVLWGKKSEK